MLKYQGMVQFVQFKVDLMNEKILRCKYFCMTYITSILS